MREAIFAFLHPLRHSLNKKVVHVYKDQKIHKHASKTNLAACILKPYNAFYQHVMTNVVASLNCTLMLILIEHILKFFPDERQINCFLASCIFSYVCCICADSLAFVFFAWSDGNPKFFQNVKSVYKLHPLTGIPHNISFKW